MEFNEYQKFARTTAIYPNIGNNLWYPALGLSGESGEVAEKIKKLYRDDKGIVSENKKVEVCKELGDCLWYIASIASELNLTLDDVAEINVLKLSKRVVDNTVHGSGDNR